MVVPQGKTCRQTCMENPFCASWYQENSLSPCYNGIGRNCKPYNSSTQTLKGERFIRGTSRSLYSFPVGSKFKPVLAAQWVNVISLKGLATPQDVITPCQEMCSSYLGCTHWQVSSVSGCWIDTSAGNREIAYPLILSNFALNPEWIAGALVQKLCPNYVYKTEQVSVLPVTDATAPAATVSAGTASAGLTLPAWAWALLAFGILLACVIVAVIVYRLRSKNKSKVTYRSIKSAQSLEEVPEVVSQPQVKEPEPVRPVQQAVTFAPMRLQTASVVKEVSTVSVGAPVYLPPVTYQSSAPPAGSVRYMTPPPRQVNSLFDALDRDGDGVITRAEFQQATQGMSTSSVQRLSPVQTLPASTVIRMKAPTVSGGPTSVSRLGN